MKNENNEFIHIIDIGPGYMGLIDTIAKSDTEVNQSLINIFKSDRKLN